MVQLKYAINVFIFYLSIILFICYILRWIFKVPRYVQILLVYVFNFYSLNNPEFTSRLLEKTYLIVYYAKFLGTFSFTIVANNRPSPEYVQTILGTYVRDYGGRRYRSAKSRNKMKAIRMRCIRTANQYYKNYIMVSI